MAFVRIGVSFSLASFGRIEGWSLHFEVDLYGADFDQFYDTLG